MIDMVTEAGICADLIQILTDDLSEIGDLAAEMVDPEHVEAARAAARAWSPRRLAHSLATEIVSV